MAKCPNCCAEIDTHPRDECILYVFMTVLRDRGNLDDEQLAEIHANCAVDMMWDDIGPILDRLEEGYYDSE
jgi:hypothetical protein